MATACGKTATLSALAQRFISKGHDVCVITHVKELIGQIFRTAKEFLPEDQIGINSASFGRKDAPRRLQICQIQTVGRRPTSIGPRKVAIVDELQLINAEEGQYRDVISALRVMVPDMRLVGLSATPWRMKSGLAYGPGRIFEDCVYRYSMRRGIEEGYLTPIVGKTGDKDFKVDGVSIRGGEFKPDELEFFMADQAKVNRAVSDMLRRLEGRNQVLVFSTGLKHNAMIKEAISRTEPSVETVDGEMPASLRDGVAERFKNRRTRIVVNNNLWTVGFDATGVDAIVLLRPTRSSGLLLQMAGRGLRLDARKKDCLFLDYAGVLSYFGPLDTIEEGVVDKHKGPPGAAPTKVCPDCDTVLHAAALVCPTCGKKFDRNLKHEEVAAEAPVMSNEPQVWGVKNMTVRKHEKPGKIPTLRLDYSGSTGFVFASEWLSIDPMADHYAYQKAIKTLSEWPGNPWTKLGDTLYSKGADGRLVKATFDTILEQARTLQPPTTITTVREGKYLAVKKRSF
jgi:DNA repair protein RadD